MKNPLIYIVIIALFIVFFLYFPASAAFNKKTGNLRLTARFKVVQFPVLKYYNKTIYEKIGKTTFFADYRTPGVVKWSITHDGSILETGQSTYKLVDAIQSQGVQSAENARFAGAKCSGGCSH